MMVFTRVSTMVTTVLLIFSVVLSTSAATKSGTTFKTCNKTASNHRFSKGPSDVATEIKGLKQYRLNNCTEILQMSHLQDNIFISDNGFVHTVVDAYRHHHNLIIRPDDVWGAIMTQFSFYINKHAEDFRLQFVNFEGKKYLEVSTAGSLRSAPYDYLVQLMSAEIDKNLIDPDTKNWILPNFTTTTENDKVTIGVVFMATMKKYFDFGMALTCGIPEITLEGTVEDWKDIHARLRKLHEYKLDDWYDMLEPIVKQFVEAKQGNVDVDFWRKMVHHKSLGSGSPYISGWITVFCAYDSMGEWQGYKKMPESKWLKIDMDDIPTGIVEVDVKIIDNGKDYKGLLIAGHLGSEIKDDGTTLQPSMGWAMTLKPDEKSS